EASVPAVTPEALPVHEDEAITKPDPIVEGHVANTIPAGESHVATDSPELTAEQILNEKEMGTYSETSHISPETDKSH
ncbi:MAG TPA: hypothetical protein VGC01_06790, partial [Mucilaginibacter sp.]